MNGLPPKKLVYEMIAALQFYGDPDSYFAIAILPDQPCGDFWEDVSDDHGGDYNRPMPGKRAREVLKKLDKWMDQ